MIDYFLHHVLRLPLTMRLRYEHKPSHHHETKLTVVFLHGIASSYAVWRQVLPALSRDPALASARLLALDLIGFGKSPKPNYFAYDYLSYRVALCHTLRKLHVRSPVLLVGHSMGCLISADFATHETQYVIPALLLVSPPVLRPADLSHLSDKFYISAYTKLRDHTDSPVIGTVASFVSRVSNFDKATLDTPAFQHSMSRIILNSENWHNFNSLKIPTRIIHGRMDPLVVTANLRFLAEHHANIELIETFGGHDISGAKLNKVVKNLRALILTYQK